MNEPGRYAESVLYANDKAREFFAEYFHGRTVLLIGGAGFDPRARLVTEALVDAGARVKAYFLKENRPSPAGELRTAAEENLAKLQDLVSDVHLLEVNIFDSDGAVVGGRRAVAEVSRVDIDGFSDVVVDVSALSIGTSFPLIRLLVEGCTDVSRTRNLHVAVSHSPTTDSTIRPTAGDRPGWVHGFSGNIGVDHDQRPAKLWMPQLAFESQQELGRIYDFVQPDDTCPILPFPSHDPRLADRLAVAFREELLGAWDVDVRNIVYADERDPLDVYRTILRIDDLRRTVFEGSGGSEVIVSPTGTKVTALGSLMACLERDLPVAYLEAEAYEMREIHELVLTTPSLVHIWLEGEAYPQDRSPLRRK